ncbi:MAG: hypothetical protein ACREDV_02345, partial [Methylocella sp.]
MSMFDRNLTNFAQPGAWTPLSRNVPLQNKKLAGGKDTPAGALSGAGSTASLKSMTKTKLARPGAATAGSGGAGDRKAHSGAVRFDVTPVLWRGGFKAAHRHSARVRLLRRVAITGSLVAIAFISAAVLL